MTEDTELMRRLADLERRHDKTRGLLVDALSVAILALVGLYQMPQGWHAVLFGFCGGFVLPGLISALFLRDAPAKGMARKPRAPAPVAPWRDLASGGRSSRDSAAVG